MRTLRIVFAIITLFILAGCQTESFNPVDQGTSFDKTSPELTKVVLVPYDKKEPNASGVINYTKLTPKNFSFRGTNLLPNKYYAVYYGSNIVVSGKSNGGGNININGTFTFTNDTQFSVWYADHSENFPNDADGKVLVEKTAFGESIK